MTQPFAILLPIFILLQFSTSFGAPAEMGYCSGAQEPVFMGGQSRQLPSGTTECPRTFTEEHVRIAFGLVQHANLVSSAKFTSIELLEAFSTLVEGHLIDGVGSHFPGGHDDRERGSRVRLDSRVRCTVRHEGTGLEAGGRLVEELAVDGEVVVVSGRASQNVWTVGMVPWDQKCWVNGRACDPNGGNVFVIGT